MQGYFARRVFVGLLTILVLSMLVFALMRIVPGDVARMLLGQDVSQSPAQLQELRHILGLDQPAPIAYLTWLKGALHGDLGRSLFTGRSVSAEIMGRISVTAELTAWSLLFTAIFGLLIGVAAAITEGGVIDHFLRVIGALGLAVPNFWLGTLILVYGGIWLNWSPSLGYQSIMSHPLQNLVQFALPGFVLALALACSLSRIVRTSFLETLHEDYVRTARAKGLRERVIIFRHVLRNALIPIITLLSIQFGALLAGTVILEEVFSIPGLGQLLIERIEEKDYTVVQGIVLLYGTVIVFLNLFTDMLYAFIDPRIGYG